MEEEKFKLTELGEAHAVEIIGGQDVANVVACFMHIIKTMGNLLSNEGYEPDAKSYFEFAQVVQLVKLYASWDELVKRCEELLEQETQYFDKNPHALSIP